MATLSVGSFPRAVAALEPTSDVFGQLVFVDHQLHEIVHSYYDGALFLRRGASVNSAAAQKVADLADVLRRLQAEPVDAVETLYYVVLLGHLHNLQGEQREAYNVLEQQSQVHFVRAHSAAENNFLEYLRTRLCGLLGAALPDSSSHWIAFLVEYRKTAPKSAVAARAWTTGIFDGVLHVLTKQGLIPLVFMDLKAQNFASNTGALVAFACHCLRTRNAAYLLSGFATEFSQYLTELVQTSTRGRADFPNADSPRPAVLDLMDCIFSSLNDVTSDRNYIGRLLKRKVAKAYLVSMAEQSFQDHRVLTYLIHTLIDMQEYDEAFAAFRTYVEYIEQEQTRANGHIDDILTVIDTYLTCLAAFNPNNSFIPDAKLTSRKFKYRTSDEVVLQLKIDCERLIHYLNRAAEISALVYANSDYISTDKEGADIPDHHLSFLYHRYNPNAFITDDSALGKTLCTAWYVLGSFYLYLSTYESISISDMKINNMKIIEYYKNGLILNCTRNKTYLFQYALNLAYSYYLESTVKLCKFILKRHPESFRAWNLLVLAFSGLECKARSLDETAGSKNSDILTDGTVNGITQAITDLERFIDDALNVAALFLNRNREKGIKTPIETRYEILQLKMTQLAVWESTRGVEYICNYITDLFVLYKELFLDLDLVHDHDEGAKLESRSIGVWSHRPSVFDPLERAQTLQRAMSLRKKSLVPLSRKSTRNEDPRSVSAAKPKETGANKESQKNKDQEKERRILQSLWLWTALVYLKLDLPEETEQCIVEAETADKPNVRTFTYLGLLTLKTRKFLALQEFERSLEVFHLPEEQYNRQAYTLTLLGLCKLFIVDDDNNNSLFISSKDLNAGLVRLKNYLEDLSHCWPCGYNNLELWYYLSGLYRKFDDKVLYTEALWRCVELEDMRPVRTFDVCENFSM